MPKGYEELKKLLQQQKSLMRETPLIFETPENSNWEQATARSDDPE